MSKRFAHFVSCVVLLGLAVLFSGTLMPTSVHAAATHQQRMSDTTTSTVATSCPATIRLGSSGTSVKALQNTLNLLYLNFSDPRFFENSPKDFGPFTQDPNNPLRVDGDFGSHTFNAVWDYQWWNGLQVDGVVGPQTWHSLGFC